MRDGYTKYQFHETTKQKTFNNQNNLRESLILVMDATLSSKVFQLMSMLVRKKMYNVIHEIAFE